MNVGIIGFARSGKTTLFNAISGAHAAVGAFGSRDANIAVIKVPDERIDRLSEIFKPKKTTYAEFQFLDIAPNESDAEKKVLDSASLTTLKNSDALVHVVRAFENENVMHPAGSVDPVRDCGALEEELQLADLIVIERRVERLTKENRKDAEYEILKRCAAHIEEGKSLRSLELSAQEANEIAGYCFLSQKALMLVGNYGEESIGEDDPSGLAAYAAEHGFTLIGLCGEMELEIAELSEKDRQAFRDDLGLGEGSRMRFLHAAYDMLGLISFITAGEPEVRAWTIRKGTHAVDAAGVIHSDLQRGFIRAEVVGYDDFIAAGTMAKAKEQGHVSVEGKDYVVCDGDMLLIRFNV
ncbi:MAG: redox-regulated ATPase YchF [Nitrospiraceae bacterium]|nr:redox-regulated ATPase YchF [Nitrospiraceae bacterium]